MVITQPAGRRATRPLLRRRILAAAAVVTLVAVAVWASSTAPRPRERQRQANLTYMAELQSPLTGEAQLAGVVQSIETEAFHLTRPQLVADLVELDETATSLDGQIASTSTAGRVTLDTTSVRNAGEDWASGARLFELGVLAALGPGVTPAAAGPGVVLPISETRALWDQVGSIAGSGQIISTLTSAASAMSAGDAAYRRFAASTASLHLTERSRLRPPAVAWVADPNAWSETELAAFEQGLGSSPSLLATHQVSLVLVSLSPLPIPPASSAGIPSIVGSGVIAVTVVVANDGNVESDGIGVSVTVTPTGTIGPASSPGHAIGRSQNVDLLPGQHQSLVFDQLALTPGNSYQLVAQVAPVPGQVSAQGTQSSEIFAVEP